MFSLGRAFWVLVLGVSTSTGALAGDEGYVFAGNERSLATVQKAYSKIPPVRYSPPAERWEGLPQPALERMEQIGRWMQVNGEAIYDTRPLPPYKVGSICLTRKGETVYAICPTVERRQLESIPLTAVRAAKAVRMLGSDTALEWEVSADGLSVRIPDKLWQSPPCEHAWTLEIAGARVE